MLATKCSALIFSKEGRRHQGVSPFRRCLGSSPWEGALQVAAALQIIAAPAVDPPQNPFLGCDTRIKPGLAAKQSLEGPFWALWRILLCSFLARAKGQNTVICQVFCALAWEKYFLQHAENCVITSVFAGRWPKNMINTVMLATPGKNNTVNTVVLGFREAKHISIYGPFFCYDLLRDLEKIGSSSSSRSSRSSSNRSNSSIRHCWRQQQPFGHRQCAKLCNS